MPDTTAIALELAQLEAKRSNLQVALANAQNTIQSGGLDAQATQSFQALVDTIQNQLLPEIEQQIQTLTGITDTPAASALTPVTSATPVVPASDAALPQPNLDPVLAMPEDPGFNPYPELTVGAGLPLAQDTGVDPYPELGLAAGIPAAQDTGADPYPELGLAAGIPLVQPQGAGVDPYPELGLAAGIPAALPTDQTGAAVVNSGIRGLTTAFQGTFSVNEALGLSGSSQDWRVRLQLAPNSNYLYNSGEANSILAPLKGSNGVIFPYTPQISTSYKANYSAVDLTHSNYKNYFYTNSAVDNITIKGTFTAQNFQEAQYVLAVIHFFRSASKMFYGATDANAGAPPPVLFLSGLGTYQFNRHPCVLTSFEYSLPQDIDYIRTSIPTDNINRQTQRQRATTVGGSAFAGILRLASALNIFGQPLTPGAIFNPRATGLANGATNNTYVPTKLEVSINLLPVQSRQQVSKTFNMRDYANGNLLRGGFW